VNLLPSPDQEAIAAAARDFLAAELPLSRLRDLAAPDLAVPDLATPDLATPDLAARDLAARDPASGAAIDEATWLRCAGLGWLALGLDERNGGLGGSLADEVMVFRELGRFLTPGPFLPGVLGARAAALGGQPALAADIAAGRQRVGLAIGDRVLDGGAGDLLLRLDAAGADLARIGDAVPLPALDPATRLARPGSVTPVTRAADPLLLARGQVLAAAMLLGIIEAVRDMSAAYARTRIQFGRPIGAFQAVKHRCADMAIAAQAATGELYQAALYVDSGHPDAAFHAAAAFLLAVGGAARSAADNIQNHGAIGFTWEHDAHLYTRRVVVLENLFGPLSSAYPAIMAPPRHEFR
jgi:alkylation response protein AidB-like acyl-CoA dehydrogenase